jgi:hypothetical protein
VLEFDDVPELALKLQDRSVLDVVSGCHWFPLVSVSGYVVRRSMPARQAIRLAGACLSKIAWFEKIQKLFYR